ncbi:DUF2798 domain-containing protein [Marinomonas sp. 2405UD68-3]|uniref:DUF2798 domain-containing protein n=1 Tax=Marinomonas sp. 2405UD68-3 TaxID=3391835 RepID=UPI0039C9DDC6
MSFCLAFFMTAWVTFLNLGITADYFYHWFMSFIFAWPAAFLIAFSIGPVVTRLANTLYQRSIDKN